MFAQKLQSATDHYRKYSVKTSRHLFLKIVHSFKIGLFTDNTPRNRPKSLQASEREPTGMLVPICLAWWVEVFFRFCKFTALKLLYSKCSSAGKL